MGSRPSAGTPNRWDSSDHQICFLQEKVPSLITTKYCLTKNQSPGLDWSVELTDDAVFLIEQRSAVRNAGLVSSGVAGRAGSTGLSGRWHEAGGGMSRGRGSRWRGHQGGWRFWAAIVRQAGVCIGCLG